MGSYDSQLCLCDWVYREKRAQIDMRIKATLQSNYIQGMDDVIEETVSQLDAYFSGSRHDFDLPILYVGTNFQKTVWQTLVKICYGTTTTYGELSEKIGQPTAARAVANANGANAISIIVPCHRVIGQSGELRGYAGGLNAKKKLLMLEQQRHFNYSEEC